MARKNSERSGYVSSKTSGFRKTPKNQSVLTKPWLAEEDKIVLELRIVGWGWMAISKKLHGRSWAACRSRFHNHLIKQYERDHSKTDKLVQSYQRCAVQAKQAFALLLNLSLQVEAQQVVQRDRANGCSVEGGRGHALADGKARNCAAACCFVLSGSTSHRGENDEYVATSQLSSEATNANRKGDCAVAFFSRNVLRCS